MMVSTKDAYKFGAPLIIKPSKEGCISLTMRGRLPEHHESMSKGGADPPQLEKHTPPKLVYRKYETWNTNMEPPKPQLPRKSNGAQSSIDKRSPPKDISSQASPLTKGP
jgi:hypothetical protein